MSNNNLVNAYMKYRVQRAKIKARQRLELERELEPLAADVGKAIFDEQRDGLRIEDIGILIGLKNRTFIYKMKEAHNKQNTLTLPDPEAVSKEPEYQIDQENETDWLVTIGDDTVAWSVSYFDGVVTTPDEWLEGNKTQRALYAKIIEDIKKR